MNRTATSAADQTSWVTVARASVYLGISNRQTLRYVKDGWLVARRKGRRGWLEIDLASIRRLLGVSPGDRLERRGW